MMLILDFAFHEKKSKILDYSHFFLRYDIYVHMLTFLGYVW